PPPDFKSLFADSVEQEQARLMAAQAEQELAERRRELLSRAAAGDKTALTEAHKGGDANLYDEILNALVRRAENERQVLALASYVSREGSLPVNLKLAEAFAQNWKDAPDRLKTMEMLHLAARAGDANFYLQAIETTLLYWRERRLSGMTAEELQQLAESEFWLLPPDARNSGAGFLLKRKLAHVRQELSAAEKQG
ncbi:MAG: hypothetical protein JOZ52_14235, partial [Acidobacteria bacterium]|nr:hypothetical protein [Acidobacteriota bacterium]